MKVPDTVLVKKAIEGDEHAFPTLLNRYSRAVYGCCCYLVQNDTDAQDMAQEVFIRAYRNLSSLSDHSKFLSWLLRIATNMCHNWNRRQKGNTVSLDAVSQEPTALPSPAERCEEKELQEKLAHAIESLPEKLQQVVILHYMSGYSCREIAEVRNISISAAQSRLHEARKRLRKRKELEMVMRDLGSHELPEDFEKKVLEAIGQAKEAKHQHVYRDVIAHCDEALDALTRLPDNVEHKEMRKEALWLKGDAFNQHADRKNAIKYHEQALELEKEIGDGSSQARLMGEIARHYTNAGDKDKALEYHKRALEVYTELGDKAGQARILQWLGGGSLSVRDVEEGISYYQRALDLFVEIGDKEWEAASHAGVKLLERFGKQIAEASREEGLSRVVFYGAARETFSRSSDALVYVGLAGTLGAFTWIEGDKDEFSVSPFRCLLSLPYWMKLLDFSLSVGGSWSKDVASGGLDPMKITATIQSDSETVSVPAGEFSNCLKTQMVTSEEPEDSDENRCGVREFIYAPGVGLVKSTFARRNGTVDIVQLTDYTVSGDSEDYFPLEVGNKWIYKWSDEEGDLPSTDVYEAMGVDKDGHYQVSHYYYALKQT